MDSLPGWIMLEAEAANTDTRQPGIVGSWVSGIIFNINLPHNIYTDQVFAVSPKLKLACAWVLPSWVEGPGVSLQRLV